MAERKEYRIRVHNALVAVTQEVYRVYYGSRRHEKTLQEKDERNGVVSYNAMDAAGMIGEDMLPDTAAASVEDDVVTKLMCEKLHRCLAQLPKDERELMDALYFQKLTERILAKTTGTHYMTIHNRKVKVLRKLKKMMEK